MKNDNTTMEIGEREARRGGAWPPRFPQSQVMAVARVRVRSRLHPPVGCNYGSRVSGPGETPLTAN